MDDSKIEISLSSHLPPVSKNRPARIIIDTYRTQVKTEEGIKNTILFFGEQILPYLPTCKKGGYIGHLFWQVVSKHGRVFPSRVQYLPGFLAAWIALSVTSTDPRFGMLVSFRGHKLRLYREGPLTVEPWSGLYPMGDAEFLPEHVIPT